MADNYVKFLVFLVVLMFSILGFSNCINETTESITTTTIDITTTTTSTITTTTTSTITTTTTTTTTTTDNDDTTTTDNDDTTTTTTTTTDNDDTTTTDNDDTTTTTDNDDTTTTTDNDDTTTTTDNDDTTTTSTSITTTTSTSTTTTTTPMNDPGMYTGTTIQLKFNNLDDFFDLSSVSEILLKFSLSEWEKYLTYCKINIQSNEIVRADEFVYYDGKGAGVSMKNVGFRIKGHVSRKVPEVTSNQKHNKDNPKWQSAHFTIKFDKNFEGIAYDYGERKLGDKYDTLDLKHFYVDPMFCRQIYCFDLLNRFGVWTSARVKYAKVYIHIQGDDKPAYFGVYAILEDYGKNMITQRQKKNIDPTSSKGIGYYKNEGNLWKCDSAARLIIYDGLDSKIGVNNEPLYGEMEIYDYDLKTNKKQLDTAKVELKDFIYNLNTKTGNEFKNWISSKMNIDLFLKTIAVETAIGNWDGYWRASRNYYLYFDTDTNKTVYYIPNDLDLTLGSINSTNVITINPLYFGSRSQSSQPLITKILAIPEYEALYKKYLIDLADPTKDLLHPDKSIPRIETWHNLIRNKLNSDIVVNVGTLTFKEFIDKVVWTPSTFNYKLLTGDDDENFFKAKVKSINTYCY